MTTIMVEEVEDEEEVVWEKSVDYGDNWEPWEPEVQVEMEKRFKSGEIFRNDVRTHVPTQVVMTFYSWSAANTHQYSPSVNIYLHSPLQITISKGRPFNLNRDTDLRVTSDEITGLTAEYHDRSRA